MELSRRQWLRLGTVSLVGTAGCTSGDDSGSPRGTDAATDGPSGTSPQSTDSSSAGDPTSTPTEHPVPTPEDYCSADASIDDDDPLTVAFDARERFKCRGDPLDNFEDLDRWDTYAGSLAADEENVFSGSQSARVEASESDDRAWIYREFEGGLDLSGTDLSIALKLDSPSTEGIVVRLAAPDHENALFLGRHVWRAGWLRLDLGPRRVDGSPDLENVTEISVQLYTGGDTSARLYLDSFRMQPRSETGAVVLTFDDNYRSQYEQAFPVMEQYGFPGVVGVVPDRVGDDGKIPLSGMREMQDAGWDMVSHPQRNGGFRTTARDQQERDLRQAKQWLVDNGFERGADFVIWPSGQYDRSALELASRYHHLGFAGGTTPTGMVTDPLVLGRVRGPDIEETKRAIDFAAEYGHVLPIVYHDIANMTTGISMRRFEEVLSHVDDSDLDVVSASGLWERLR